MGFKSGNEWNGNASGRPRASVSTSYKLRSILNNHFDENLLQYLEECKSLRMSHVKATLIINLMQFVVARLSQTDARIDIKSLNNDEVTHLLNAIRNDSNEQ